MGPTGCGQTTLLGDIARTCRSRVDERGLPKDPTPCVTVSIRLGSTGDHLGGSKEQGHAAIFDETVANIFRQIGYPTRRALVNQVVQDGITVISGVGGTLQMSLGIPTVADRATYALGLFFQTAADVCREREARGMKRADAAPVLLWDEMHDLIKDSRYASMGGRQIFKFLSAHLLAYSTNKELIRPVVAGSSGELKFKMATMSFATGERVEEYMLQDPSEDVVRSALEERGYSPQDAAMIVEECGPRVRLLDDALKAPVLPTASAVVAQRKSKARGQFLTVFEALGPNDQRSVIALLDRIAHAEKTGQQPPTYLDIPAAATAADFSQLAFITNDGRRPPRTVTLSESTVRREAPSQTKPQAASHGPVPATGCRGQ